MHPEYRPKFDIEYQNVAAYDAFKYLQTYIVQCSGIPAEYLGIGSIKSNNIYLNKKRFLEL